QRRTRASTASRCDGAARSRGASRATVGSLARRGSSRAGRGIATCRPRRCTRSRIGGASGARRGIEIEIMPEPVDAAVARQAGAGANARETILARVRGALRSARLPAIEPVATPVFMLDSAPPEEWRARFVAELAALNVAVHREPTDSAVRERVRALV